MELAVFLTRSMVEKHPSQGVAKQFMGGVTLILLHCIAGDKHHLKVQLERCLLVCCGCSLSGGASLFTQLKATLDSIVQFFFFLQFHFIITNSMYMPYSHSLTLIIYEVFMSIRHYNLLPVIVTGKLNCA